MDKVSANSRKRQDRLYTHTHTHLACVILYYIVYRLDADTRSCIIICTASGTSAGFRSKFVKIFGRDRGPSTGSSCVGAGV